MNWQCRVGYHKSCAGSGSRPGDALRWCLLCGTTWEATYDGIEAGWRKRRDLHFGFKMDRPPRGWNWGCLGTMALLLAFWVVVLIVVL